MSRPLSLRQFCVPGLPTHSRWLAWWRVLVLVVILTQTGLGRTDFRAVAQSEPPQSQTLTKAERAAREKKCAQLWETAQTARNKDDYAAAIKAAQALLAIEQELLGDKHQELIGTLEFLAGCHQSNADFASAKSVRVELVKRVTQAYGPDDYRVVDAKLAVKQADRLAELTPDQRKQLAEAEVANGRVVRLYQAGQFADAVKLAERVLETRRGLFGEDHPDTSLSLNNLAELYRSQANYAAAEPLFQRTLKITEKTLGPDHPDTASNLNYLAKLYYSQANYAAAEPLYQRALKIREKTLGPDHPDTATSLNDLAALYYSQANYAAAERLYQRALKIREKTLGPDHRDTATSLNNLAALYKSQGNYTAAEPLYQRTLKIYEKALGPDHPNTATSLNNLAELNQSQANYAAAEPLFQRALKIHEKVLGPDHPLTATSLNYLAGLYMLQGNYAAAEPLYQRALKIREKALGPDHPDTATSLNGLAELYRSQANYAAAEPLYQRALKIREKTLGPDHPYTALSLNNLAGLYNSQANYAAAEPLFQRALKIREKTLGPDHPYTALSLNNLAGLYDSQANYAAAEPLFQRALKIFEKTLGADHPYTAGSLNNLAGRYYSQANYPAAEPLYQRALKINEKALGPEHPTTATALANLVLLQWGRDQPDTAASLAEQAVGIRLRHLDATAAIQTEQQQFMMSRTADINVSVWLTVSGAKAQLTPQVYRDVLAWKGLITARQQGLRRALKDDPLFAEFRRVTQQLSTVALNPPLPPSNPQAIDAWRARESELRRNWESQKEKLEVEHERLEKELAVKSVPFRESLEQRRVKPEDLVAALKAQEQPTALVDVLEYGYVPRKDKGEKYERRIVAFVVRGDRPVVRVELGSADEIAEQLDTWRDSILSRGENQEIAEELRTQVWLPIETHLQGIETVLISTDGVLGLLPFEALPGKKDGTLLIEDYRLAFVPVPQLIPGMLAKPKRSLAGERLLLVGDVDYGTNATGEYSPWEPLRGTADELAALSILHGSKFPAAEGAASQRKRRGKASPAANGLLTLSGADATEREVAERLAQFPLLHFATHGLFEETEQRVIPRSQAFGGTRGEAMASAFDNQPQTVKVPRSGLVLAGANRKPNLRADGAASEVPDDGLLMDNEILAMPLENASLVVMSACNTAQGKQQSGEGLLGIQRAFQVAGARTTVASLWHVDDAATVLLMQRFYENLWAGKLSRVDALHEAQLWMLRSGKPALRESARRALARSEESRGAQSLLDELDKSRDDRLPPFFWAAFVLSGDWR
ncbi:MAG: tetratricopeptide repeat protein [Planctomycetaceae bacterium]